MFLNESINFNLTLFSLTVFFSNSCWSILCKKLIIASGENSARMTLPRCVFQVTKQCISKRILQSNLRQTYCETRHSYSSKANRRFSERHEWVTIDQDTGTVGISKYAEESLGDVVFAQLPSPGTKLNAGDECGALESVKAASEIYSPVSGMVTEKNKDVENKPGLINTSCYDKGWLFKLKLTEPDQFKDLMTEKEYELFLKTDTEKETT